MISPVLESTAAATSWSLQGRAAASPLTVSAGSFSAAELQNMDMAGEAIEQCAGETLALEDARPFFEWEISTRRWLIDARGAGSKISKRSSAPVWDSGT